MSVPRRSGPREGDAEVEELLQIGLGLFGGLALFLYGMNLMSNNLQEAAGERMRAILAAASDPAVTSFAGGLPNPISFPQEKLLESMQRVVAERGPEAFQYSVTAGVPELRAWIAERYNHRFGTDYTEEDVLVTTGSQQVLDLLGKVLLDKASAETSSTPSPAAPTQPTQ